jgi:hypothetical protein
MRLPVRAFKTKFRFRYSGGEEARLDGRLAQRDLDAPVLLYRHIQSRTKASAQIATATI